MMLGTTLYGWHWNQARRGIRMWHFIVECSRINHHIFSLEGVSEAVQAPWSRAVQEFTGAVTGTKYNNNGITPDVAADDPTAVDKALELLKQKI